MSEIRCENVSLYYKKQPALQNVSFTIPENTICGLLGRNGSGKTSLMSLIASYLPATSGTVLCDGQPVFDNPSVMPDVALVYNKGEEESNMKVRDIFRDAAQLRPHWDEEYAQKLIAKTGIPLNKRLSTLSRGMQATAWAIVGLASRSPVTLYDEAYSGMDAAVRTWFIQEILDDFLQHPRTIIFSTHFINEVENLLGEVLVLDEGRVLLNESVDSLREKGTTITGERGHVDEVIAAAGSEPLSVRTLGSQKEAVLYGKLAQEVRDLALQRGLALSKPSLQDLFVHITEKEALPSQSR